MEAILLIGALFVGIHFFTQYRLEQQTEPEPVAVSEENSESILFGSDKKPVIVAFGDSFTAGVGAPKGSDWTVVLSQMLDDNIINASKSGEMSGYAAARLSSVLAQYHPDIVFLQKGGDDLLNGRQHTTIAQNLIKLVRIIQKSGAKPVLIGFPNLDLLDMMITSDMELFSKVVDRTGTYYIPDVYGPVLRDESLKSDDLVHPNAKGYHQIAERIYNYLREHPL